MEMYLRSGQMTINDRIFTGRLAFDIELMQAGAYNDGTTLRAWNLSRDSRNWISNVAKTSQKTVSMFAGYQGKNSLIFSGQIFDAFSERKGVDIITTIKANSGLQFFQQCHIEFNGVKTDYEIYQLCVGQLAKFGLVTGFLSGASQTKLQGNTHKKGMSDAGIVSRFLTTICNRAGLKWNVNNGALNIYDPGAYEDNDEFFLSINTGMVGNISKNTDDTFQVTSLLNPGLVVGKKVKIESLDFKGLVEMKIIKVKHVGDTWEGEDWNTILSAAALGKVNFLGMKGS